MKMVRKLDFEQCSRTIESTARMIKDKYGIATADKALRDAIEAIRRDASRRNGNIG